MLTAGWDKAGASSPHIHTVQRAPSADGYVHSGYPLSGVLGTSKGTGTPALPPWKQQTQIRVSITLPGWPGGARTLPLPAALRVCVGAEGRVPRGSRPPLFRQTLMTPEAQLGATAVPEIA